MWTSRWRLSTALWTSSLKSSRIRVVAIWPIVPPKISRITSVRPEETEARRQDARAAAPRPRCCCVRRRPSVFEDVPRAAFGVEEAGLAARLELASQVGGEDVDRVRRGHRVGSPDFVGQTLAGDDQALVAHQELEQLELAVGELDFALAAVDLAGVGVQLQVADLERGGAARRPTAQQRADPRQQLLALEGLDQVVVGARVEAGDAVPGLGAGGPQQDRHVALHAQAPADLDPVEAGEAEVEHDQVGDEPDRDVERLDPVGGGADLVALVAQRAAQDVGDIGVVLDYEDAAALLDLGIGAEHGSDLKGVFARYAVFLCRI